MERAVRIISRSVHSFLKKIDSFSTPVLILLPTLLRCFSLPSSSRRRKPLRFPFCSPCFVPSAGASMMDAASSSGPVMTEPPGLSVAPRANATRISTARRSTAWVATYCSSPPTTISGRCSQTPTSVAFGCRGNGSSSEDLNLFDSDHHHRQKVTAPLFSKKWFKTKFTPEQKKRMLEFAGRWGGRSRRRTRRRAAARRAVGEDGREQEVAGQKWKKKRDRKGEREEG